MGCGRVHREGDQNIFEHEDHEQQIFDPRKFPQPNFVLSLRPPRHRGHHLHRPQPDLRRGVHQLKVDRF